MHIILYGSVIFYNYNEISEKLYEKIQFFSIFEGHILPDYKYIEKYQNTLNP